MKIVDKLPDPRFAHIGEVYVVRSTRRWGFSDGVAWQGVLEERFLPAWIDLDNLARAADLDGGHAK